MYASKIIKVQQETSDTKSIRFEKPEGFEYRPGQFGIFEHQLDDELIRRSYSFSSSPTEDFLQVTVKHVFHGKMSSYLTSLKPGAMLHFNGPFGKFLLDDRLNEVVFIAGGSGISPFRGMCRYIFDKALKMQIILVYGSRSPQDIILKEELEAFNKEKDNFSLYLTVDTPSEGWDLHVGFIDKGFLNEATGHTPLEKTFFICGPPKMVIFTKNNLRELGVPESQIHIDAWG